MFILYPVLLYKIQVDTVNKHVLNGKWCKNYNEI